MLLSYFARLPGSKQALWCYLIWYLCMLGMHFNPAPELWLNSLGLSIVVGYALYLSTGPGTWSRFKARFWESLRLFMCPFLVSSFSALVKGKGFILLFSPNLKENLFTGVICLVFVLTVKLLSSLEMNKQANNKLV